MAVRSGDEYDQSLVNTIIVLPMVVTGIVIIVQNTLALAFSLAGIAGAVRFRNSLKSSGDALFILLAVSIGLARGIRRDRARRGRSACSSTTRFAMLWVTEYGEREGMKRYLADYDGVDETRSSSSPTRRNKLQPTQRFSTFEFDVGIGARCRRRSCSR